jgi:hypothetical protein
VFFWWLKPQRRGGAPHREFYQFGGETSLASTPRDRQHHCSTPLGEHITNVSIHFKFSQKCSQLGKNGWW